MHRNLPYKDTICSFKHRLAAEYVIRFLISFIFYRVFSTPLVHIFSEMFCVKYWVKGELTNSNENPKIWMEFVVLKRAWFQKQTNFLWFWPSQNRSMIFELGHVIMGLIGGRYLAMNWSTMTVLDESLAIFVVFWFGFFSYLFLIWW